MPNPANIELARGLLNSIAMLARALHEGLIDVVDEDTDNGTAYRAVVLQPLACQLGWMADMGSQALGGSVHHGGAEDWMLSPRSRELVREISTARGGRHV